MSDYFQKEPEIVRKQRSCPKCNGLGLIERTAPYIGGVDIVQDTCPECNGKGTVEYIDPFSLRFTQ